MSRDPSGTGLEKVYQTDLQSEDELDTNFVGKRKQSNIISRR